jgi:hypothetical protein
MEKRQRLFGRKSRPYISYVRKPMTQKSGYEIRISVGQHDIDELQAGKLLQIGLISFGLPIKVSMKKRKSPEKVAKAKE